MPKDTQQPVASPGQAERCGATTGPSAEEWETHRATITNLYKTMKWTELDAVMKKEHGFYASKRMYNQRFRQWNITKYLKISEKSELLKECGWSVAELTQRYKAGKIKKSQYDKTLRWFRSTQPSFPARPASLDVKAASTEIILRSLRNYHQSLAESELTTKGTLDSRFLDLETSKESSDLWFAIIRGVKSLSSANALVEGEVADPKSAVSANALATAETTFSMLRQAGFLAAPAMMKRPLDFVYELLVELTAFQSKEWPKIRNVILRLFNQEASRVFGPEHPIAMICREMQRDENSHDVASRGMECIKDIAVELWGEKHVLTFKIQTAIYTAVLKSGNTKQAGKIGHQLLLSSQEMWGVDSTQARIAHSRLGLLYLKTNEQAMARGKLDKAAVENALQHFHEVIKLPPAIAALNPRKAGFHEDETSLSAMADIAFLYNRVGNDTEALTWYQRSAELSRRICDPGSNVTRAAISELIAKLREMNRFEQAAAWEAIMNLSETTT
ncbi:hypothetical protein AB5N19_09533 [Seiridium cardinale]|uniref:Clr5 domain-containing protein n=1 Tax=Seiridium cardinale TaxID=138064 RepID=A0ABR2Y8I0_9PEZI